MLRRSRTARLTLKSAPQQRVFDIRTNHAEAEDRFAMNTSDRSDWELRGKYWQEKQKLERAHTEWGRVQNGSRRPDPQRHRRRNETK
ncbi:hypothetical protein [Brevundimonas sp.]|uniref:hypothetical protein n=1 Tax=Brevundimonas sp. TaxID=1871086 RepID=UPI001AD051C4|nr:hypothetical protein [Brevundimonas sp.]MBN9466178.1 hypothetical protein [Brevundimonas sp.]